MSGVFLSIGCAVYLSAESKPLGAFLFSLGLYSIICFGLNLYTGKAGYMAVKPPSYILEVLFTFIGNIIGTAFGGTALTLTRFGGELSLKAAAVIDGKFTDDPLSIFILAFFCGILMFTAVDGNKKAAAKNNFIGGVFLAVLPVMVFITCGFNHSVADTAYFFLSRCHDLPSAPFYFILAVLGNAVGCMTIPFIKKMTDKAYI